MTSLQELWNMENLDINDKINFAMSNMDNFSIDDQLIIQNQEFRNIFLSLKNEPIKTQVNYGCSMIRNMSFLNINDDRLYIKTTNFGRIKNETQVRYIKIDNSRFLTNIKFDLLNRNLIENNKEYDQNILLNLFHILLPSLDWFYRSLLVHSNLSDQDKSIINEYISYSYNHMNNNLRNDNSLKSENAALNGILNKLLPLEQDIIVYRYVWNVDFIREKFHHKGYISTTISVNFMSDLICDDQYDGCSILKILIPKGTHCIYIPSSEYEIIFPHNLELEYVDKSNQTFYTESKSKSVTVYHMKMTEYSPF